MLRHKIYFMLLLTAAFLSLSACGGSGSNNNSVENFFDTGAGFDGVVLSIAPATDGSGDIYVGGNFQAYNGNASSRIVRLNADGSIDTGFDVGTGFNDFVQSIEPATDGSGDIYVGGDFTIYRGSSSFRIARLNNDGSLDAGFVVGTGFDAQVYDVALATDGSGDVYVGGEFSDYQGNAKFRIARLNSDGSNDIGFDNGTGLSSPFSINANRIVPTTDVSGDVYVGGLFEEYRGNARNHIVRINGDGSIDLGFDPGTGFNFAVFSIVLATDGSGDIYVGGIFTDYRGIASNRIVRLNADGSIDTGFDVGTGFNSVVQSIAPAADGSGDIYVGGAFTDYRGKARAGLTRINSDGSNDPGFKSRSGFDDSVQSIAVATDGSGDIYVGGVFKTYQSIIANRIIRLDSSGARN